ncbi:hypothetical protein B0J11DRAFT_528240 [Dendryphion nanum]|uniref:RRM domain-containing protein n=1 Tax=Dendryphion nanum TaxID=256645 RepID=A0A9P9INA7_9PLEO|nr:hypothetical protein B0J11DRAFT_528240 [Dendryphion nanum]
MAPETKKRKGATDASPKAKKQKKADDTAQKSSAKALKAAVAPIDDLAVKVKATRKRAADFFDEKPTPKGETTKSKKGKKENKKEIAAEEDVPVTAEEGEKPKRSKRTKVVEVAVTVPVDVIEEPVVKAKKNRKGKSAPTEDAEPSAITDKKLKKAKVTKKQKEASLEPEVVIDDEQDEDGQDEDDQTAALLAGFESDRDESDAEKEDEGDIVPSAIPDAARKSLAKLSQIESDKPGVIYIGRVPHGFYEPQMKAYFKQFGDVTQLRLSRNKRTGASKHYAFVEFASSEVAEIVAKTMNNYLMFGHILQCKIIQPEDVHENLFKGASERFKHVPRNKIAAMEFERGATRDVWEKRVKSQKRKRGNQAKILKEEFGYDFAAPELKSVDEVPKQVAALIDGAAQQLLLEAPAEEVTATVTKTETKPNGVEVTETVKVKKSKKAAKAQSEPEAEVIEVAEVVETIVESKPKKTRKTRSSAAAELEEEPTTTAGAEEGLKPKKTRRSSQAAADADKVVPEKKRSVSEGGKLKKAKKAKA